MFWVKEHVVKRTVVVAICDDELLNRRIGELKVKIKEEFYGGKRIPEMDVIKYIERAGIGNLIGKRIIEMAIKHNFIDRKNIIYIGDVPHAQFIK